MTLKLYQQPFFVFFVCLGLLSDSLLTRWSQNTSAMMMLRLDCLMLLFLTAYWPCMNSPADWGGDQT